MYFIKRNKVNVKQQMKIMMSKYVIQYVKSEFIMMSVSLTLG